MIVKREAAMVVNWPNLPGGGGRGFGGGGGAAAQGNSEARAAYDRRVAELGDWLDRARHYDLAHEKGNAANFHRDLKLEALGPIVKGEVPVLVFTDDARVIEDAVKFCEKQKVKMVLATGEAAAEKKDFLKQHNVNVVLGPTLELVRYEDDPYDTNLALPHDLNAAGVKIAFASYTNEFARRLSQQAGVAVAFGLPRDEALKALTLYPAQMFGMDKELGTLEAGKMANVIVTNGDPLELTTEVKYLFIKGELTSLDNRHLDLYNKYKKRP
jgi:imidazolonepropionase-like amidohydrolase